MVVDEKTAYKIGALNSQGDKFMFVLACMIRNCPNGVERFGQLCHENGHAIYASFRRQDIERTCGSPDIHQISLLKEDRTLFVNITLARENKSKLVKIAGRRLGYSAHEVNQFDSLIGPSVTERRREAMEALRAVGLV